MEGLDANNISISVKTQVIIVTAVSAGLGFYGNHCAAALDVFTQQFGPLSLDNFADALPYMLSNGLGHLLLYPFGFAITSSGYLLTLTFGVLPWIVWLLWYSSHDGGDRPGEQHGSAKWATRADLVQFATAGNPDPRNVLILSEHYGLALSREHFDQAHDRNMNVFVMGGSGSGKTRYFVKPNVAQRFGNYFITDPKGTLLPEVGQGLVDDDYTIACFNTNITDNSLIYNPFTYLVSDLDILQFVDGFMSMTGDQKKSGDPFWDDATRLLFCALIGYLRDWTSKDDYNMGSLLTLLDMAQVKEEDENYKSPLDQLFEEIETGWHLEPGTEAVSGGSPSERGLYQRPSGPKKVPSMRVNNTTKRHPGTERVVGGVKKRGLSADEDFSLSLYKKFKVAAGKTMKSILITSTVKLTALITEDVRRIMVGDDQMHLELLGDPERKFAFFDTFQDTNQKTLGFLHGLLVWQAINVAVKQADSTTGKLKRPLIFLLDEFKSLNLPKQVGDMISVVRSRNIGMCIIVQSREQLLELYDEHAANGIIGCCDTQLYLGGSEEKTNEVVSKNIGQMTVEDHTVSRSHQGLWGGSYSVNESRHGRALIDEAEVGKLPREKCIVMIKGTDAGIDDKYHLEEHPNYDKMDPGHKPVKIKERKGLKVIRKKVAARYSEPFDLKQYMVKNAWDECVASVAEQAPNLAEEMRHAEIEDTKGLLTIRFTRPVRGLKSKLKAGSPAYGLIDKCVRKSFGRRQLQLKFALQKSGPVARDE